MVRENRIKHYSFSISNLTANPSGTLSVYSDHPLNGVVQKIFYRDGNFAANGSLFIYASGAVQETLWSYKNAVADQTVYPVVFGVDSTNTTGSPGAIGQLIIDTPLRIVASGVGASTSGLGLIIYYV